MLPSPVRRFADTAGGLLNRLVFVGIECCDDVLDRVPLAGRAPPRDARALATVSTERLVPELTSAGMRRMSRFGAREQFCDAGGRVRVWIEPASLSGASPADEMVREYSILLTRALPVPNGPTARVAVPFVQVALWWREHLGSGRPLWDSPAAENAIELVARAACSAGAMRAAPVELASEIRQACESVLADATSRLAIARALPEARTTPGFADVVLGRLREVAG